MKIFFSPILDLIHFVLCCLPKIEQESIFTVETFEFIQKLCWFLAVSTMNGLHMYLTRSKKSVAFNDEIP